MITEVNYWRRQRRVPVQVEDGSMGLTVFMVRHEDNPPLLLHSSYLLLLGT